jgi:hypothetical protein
MPARGPAESRSGSHRTAQEMNMAELGNEHQYGATARGAPKMLKSNTLTIHLRKLAWSPSTSACDDF